MLRICLTILLIQLSFALHAADELSAYNASYEASYGGMKATLQRSLTAQADGHFQFESTAKLKLLGQTLTTIREKSLFHAKQDSIMPNAYEFVQTGIGSRTHSAQFNQDQGNVITRVNGEETIVAVGAEPVYDDLSVLIQIRKKLQAGDNVITLMAVDKNRIDEENFRVLETETLATPLGEFEAIKLEKIRPPENDRITHFWFAPELDYLLVKLYQQDSNGREVELEISAAEFPAQSLPEPATQAASTL
ncbi:MAG: DUF3108 domain-containing protein [Pseudohongiellaceae bacterium]